MSNSQIARTLFDAFEAGDEQTIREICSADMTARQNLNPEMNLDTLLGFSLAVNKIVPDLHYEHIVCSDTGTGFVEEHEVCGSLPDGSELRICACVVADIEGGKIVSLREYVDTASAQNLLAALSA